MTTALQFAELFIKNIVCLHSLPDSIVSDHSTIFTSLFWKTLANNLSINHDLSTAFYPQTDRQMECMNQILEQYLWLYCNYQQDDWYNLLPLAEFAYNNTYQDTTKASLFYANYSHYSRFNPELYSKTTTSISMSTEKCTKFLWGLHDWLVKTIKLSQNTQARFYDTKHKPVEFSIGNKVWLAVRNTRTEQASKKLYWKKIDPYWIIAKVGAQAYRLELLFSLRIHPIFYISLLEWYHKNTISRRIAPPPPSVIVSSY